MTDRFVVGVAVLLALVLLAAVTVVARGGGVAGAATVLRAGAGSRLLVSGQPERGAIVGVQVPDGAVVEAGPEGAVLATRGREVHLAAAARVKVVDGAEQQLQAGSLVVDSRRAPGMTVTTDAATVAAPRDGLVRVDAGPMVRVGLFSGPPADVRAIGRRTPTELPRLYQVQVARGSAPGNPSPLMLRADALEQRLAADLVAVDAMLADLALQLRRTGSSVGSGAEQVPAAAPLAGTVVLAALQRDVPTARQPAPGPATGETALDYLMATARERGDDVAGRVARVDELRDAGGSWSVVAGLVGVAVDAVGARLQQLLAPLATASLAGGGGQVDLGDLLDRPASPAPGFAAVPGAVDPTPPGTSDPASSPADSASPQPGPPAPSPPPSPAPGPALPSPAVPTPAVPTPRVPSSPTDVVGQVVDAVLGVLQPSPSGSPSPSRRPLPLPSRPVRLPLPPVLLP